MVEILFIDFLLQAMDQVVNQAAKYRFMSGGEGRVPLVIRTQGGAGNSLAGQHSQSLEALYYHIPGLKVVMPATPRDAKGLLKAAIRDEDPVIFIEHKLLYMTEGEVPDEPYDDPARQGRHQARRHGRDPRRLVAHGPQEPAGRRPSWRPRASSTEVIDLRTLVADGRPTASSNRSAGPAAWSSPRRPIKRGGVGSDVAAIVAEQAFDSLRAPIVRVAGMNTVIPFNLALEKATVPQVADIVAGVRSVMGRPVGEPSGAAAAAG